MRFLPGTTVKYRGPLAIERVLQVVVSAAVVLGVTLGLWAPGVSYWEGLSGALGPNPTFVLVGTLAVGLGIWFSRTSGFRLGELAAGTVLGYAGAMGGLVAIGTAPSADLLGWYGILAGSFLAGAVIWSAIQRSRRA